VSTPSRDREEIRERLDDALARGDLEAVGDMVAEMHPSDLADLVESLEEEEQVRFLSALPTELASETLVEMEDAEDLLAALHPEKGAELLHELADDDAADLIGDLEPEERRRILEALPVEEAGDIRGLLLYHEETAGGLMTTEFVSVRDTLSAQEALDEVRLQGREVEDFYTVFVVDERRRLVGTLRLDDLVIAEPMDRVEALVEAVPVSVLPDLDQEEVGRLMSRYNMVAVPVVNEFGVLLGRITFDDVIDVLEAEQTEDILMLAGVGNDEEALRHTWIESVRSRLPWLFVNLLTAFMAAAVPYAFSKTIQSSVILAVFMPIIAGMGGNAGTQALAVAVRTIAVEGAANVRAMELVWREVVVGIINGLVLGLTTALVSWVIPGGNPRLGLVVLAAMWGNLVVAGFAGSFVPVILDRLGIDPAVASSIFVTTFTDMCGFFLLLGLASAFLL
jgi:magnesium transporter